MDRLRVKRVEEACSGTKVLAERDTLLLLRGVTARMADLLQHAGYKTPHDIVGEQDIDRLAIRTGLGSKRAQELRDAVLAYEAQDAVGVEEGQKLARERQAEAEAKQRAEVAARVSAEAEARAAAEAAKLAADDAAKAPGTEAGGG
jgi:membrane protein involved in colicin uptake